eukprot:TRINITY_DN2651_c0_g1_i3.p1 TRINITY_DN2651_c0_g1~~TRINITY_DN2651_c0_g1_i3.p1  ORF type:complete len:406 (-),score=57.36 TRINITY_DN2651_c0_g1_i3:76-1293(-)
MDTSRRTALQSLGGQGGEQEILVADTAVQHFGDVGFFRVFLMLAGTSLFAVCWHSAWNSTPKARAAISAVGIGLFYNCVSAAMIQSNKWLMHADHFPYPFTLTAGHMLMSFALANVCRYVCPSMFPSFSTLDVTPKFCVKFLWIGIPFACSLVCGNWAYKYLSVSFLQIMKQANVITIYLFSVVAALERFRWCSVIILAFLLSGTVMGVEGEMHFVFVGFALQVACSLTEALKIIAQSVFMSGQAKLDPLTLVLFMAPACFVANLIPLTLYDWPNRAEICARFLQCWPVVLGNASTAFILNCTVAQCIKQLSAVGFLVCGITKDIVIIVVSTWLLGESLTPMQKIGFSVTVIGVTTYALYKQNVACFEDDSLRSGFTKLFQQYRSANAPEKVCLSGFGISERAAA